MHLDINVVNLLIFPDSVICDKSTLPNRVRTLFGFRICATQSPRMEHLTKYRAEDYDPRPRHLIALRARFLELHVYSVQLLPTSRADREPPKGLGLGVGLVLGLGLGSGLGSGWSGQRNRRFVRTWTYGAAIHKSLLNFRANLKNLARTCNFTGALIRGELQGTGVLPNILQPRSCVSAIGTI